MFGRIHFYAASLFPAMVIMTSIAVTLKHLRRIRKQYDDALEQCYIEMFEILFEKNGK